MERRTRNVALLAVGFPLLLSVLAHLFIAGGTVVAVVVAKKYARPDPPEPKPPVEVEFVSREQIAELLPPEMRENPDADPSRPPDTSAVVQPRPEAPKPRAPEPKAVAPTPPQPPPPVIPPPPEEPKPKPQPSPPRSRMKSVDLPDDNKKEPDNPNAQFLANENRKVEEQTRAKNTNLVRNDRESKLSSDKKEEQQHAKLDDVGDEKPKIAEMEDRKAKGDGRAPGGEEKAETPRPTSGKPDKAQKGGPEGKTPPLAPRPVPDRKLAMRDLAPPGEIGPARPADPRTLATFGPPPTRPSGSPQPDAIARGDRPVMPSYASAHIHAGAGGARGEGLGRGEDADASSGGDSAKKSRGWGKWKKHHDFVMAQLENFVPEVKPGNQTALNTRADPFARYIARMHNKIHKGWGFGLLEDLMTRSSSHPMNDLKLWAVVEIVLKNDGSVEKLTVIRRSGVMVYDAAAVEVVAASAPFARPPASILSGNGKVYVHWQFNRDERQCGTFGATPFILDNASERSSAKTADASQPQQVYHVREIPLPSGGGDATPRRGEDRRAGGQTREIALPDAGARPLPAREQPEARRTAARWLKALAAHDQTELTVLSRVPFKVGGRVIARSEAQLVTLAQELFKDLPKTVASSVELYRASGLRARFGSVPPGANDGDGKLYAVGRIGKEALILQLGQGSGWRVEGLTR